MQEEEEEESKTGSNRTISNVTLHDSSWTGMVPISFPFTGFVSVQRRGFCDICEYIFTF